jgi:hypothetical protein
MIHESSSNLNKKIYSDTFKDKLKIILKKSSIISNNYNKILEQGIIKKDLRYTIDIKITPNNIFCTFRSLKTTLIVLTAGILKIKLTKRKLKFVSKILVQKFIKNLKKTIQGKVSILNISGPIKLVKKIVTQFVKELSESTLIINIKNKKSFNGCRPKKARKKKRKGLRVRA